MASGETPTDILSAARIAELRANIPAETLRLLVEECLADFTGRVPLLKEAVADRDGPRGLAQAHAMAGMAASYGMLALEMRLRTLMHQLCAGPAKAATLLDGLNHELEQTAMLIRHTIAEA